MYMCISCAASIFAMQDTSEMYVVCKCNVRVKYIHDQCICCSYKPGIYQSTHSHHHHMLIARRSSMFKTPASVSASVTLWYCHTHRPAISICRSALILKLCREGIVDNPALNVILCAWLGFTTHTTYSYICRQVRRRMNTFIGLAAIFLLIGLVGVATVLGMYLMTEATDYEVSLIHTPRYMYY